MQNETSKSNGNNNSSTEPRYRLRHKVTGLYYGRNGFTVENKTLAYPVVGNAALAVVKATWCNGSFDNVTVEELTATQLQVFTVRGKEHVVALLTAKDGTKLTRVSTHSPTGRIGGFLLPTDIAALSAGKDAWMRKVLFTCKQCNKVQPLGGHWSGGGYCEACAEASVQDSEG